MGTKTGGVGPPCVYVAGQKISVVRSDSLRAIGVAGTFEFQAGEILLDGTMGEEAQKATAIHEIVHALDLAAGTRMKERDVCAFGSLLFAFIRENMGFMEWVKQSP